MSNVQSLERLIESFLARSISALDFEKRFLSFWNENANLLEEKTYDCVESLFFSVDEFTDISLDAEDNPNDFINEDQLRDAAAKTLEKLQALDRS